MAAGLGVAVLLSAPAPRADGQMIASRLTIETRNGPVSFVVELAETAERQERGLMFRRELAADAGMLFDFGVSRVLTMWMKNTYLPLDMLFIDAGGIVASIARDTEPMSTTIISSKVPARAVLEINAGAAARLGIRPGDRVDHPIFAPRGAPTTPPAGAR